MQRFDSPCASFCALGASSIGGGGGTAEKWPYTPLVLALSPPYLWEEMGLALRLRKDYLPHCPEQSNKEKFADKQNGTHFQLTEMDVQCRRTIWQAPPPMEHPQSHRRILHHASPRLSVFNHRGAAWMTLSPCEMSTTGPMPTIPLRPSAVQDASKSGEPGAFCSVSRWTHAAMRVH